MFYLPTVDFGQLVTVGFWTSLPKLANSLRSPKVYFAIPRPVCRHFIDFVEYRTEEVNTVCVRKPAYDLQMNFWTSQRRSESYREKLAEIIPILVNSLNLAF